MRIRRLWVGLGVLILTAGASGCMRFQSDKYYEHNARVEIVENGPDGSRAVTSASYKEWGRGPGVDNTYGTADDDISGYGREVRDANGRLSSVSVSESPGPDQLWFTDDDVFVSLASFLKNGANEYWTFHSPRLARVESVLDDIWNPPSVRRLSSGLGGGWQVAARPRSILNYENDDARYSPLFVDGIPANLPTFRFVRTAVAEGFTVRQLIANGADGLWNTDDDVVGRFWKVVRTGATYSILEFSQAGHDGVWGSSDDTFASGAFLGFNAAGEIIGEKYATDMGADGIPFNADDTYAAIIENRIWTSGTTTFASVLSSQPFGENDSTAIDRLPYKNVHLFISDSSFLANYWTGAHQHFRIYLSSEPSDIDYEMVFNKVDVPSNDIAGLARVRGFSKCHPTNLVTLEPCVSLVVQEKYPDLAASERVRRIADDAVQSEPMNTDPFGLGFSSKVIKIDRTGQP